MRRFPTRSQEEYLLQDLLKLVWNLHKSGQSGYSQLVEFGVMELVRRQMRQIALKAQVRESEELLRRAVTQTHDKLQERLEGHKLTFDFSPYFQNAAQQLRYVAKEMQELAEGLRQLEQPLQQGKPIASATGVEFKIKEVGLREVEALIVTPLASQFELDLEWLRQSYSVEGEWFPFYVLIEELGFVVDDDGTIFISTENFPDLLLEQARKLMVGVAHQLYCSHSQPGSRRQT